MPKSIYDNDFDNSMAQSKRDGRIPNKQLKNAWLNKCQRLILRDFHVVTNAENFILRRAVIASF